MKPLFGIAIVLLISAGIALAGSQGSVKAGPYPVFMLCASVGFLLHWAVFLPSFIQQTEHFFDLTGGVSYVATVALALLAHPAMDARGQLLCVLVTIWAVRLSTFLFLRVRKAGKDRRFDEIKQRFFRFAFTWTMGGGWVFITLAAALAAMTSVTQKPLGLFAGLGVAVWLAGFTIEVIADQQKTRFRNDPDNADKFITSGLWSRSRHPNYFGEIVLWFGVTIIALPVLGGWQWLTLVSPLFVTGLLIKVSGVRLLEASGQQRWGSDPAYRQYLENTPMLIPALRPGARR